ncbi:hypothetical protein [Tenacibaculum sp. UWU-22]|uniref:hypothetical protein n=1 Tax=Tenacibaculum sp. UWU-22 TaxID=3234187 RepID=UPI0034DAFC1F
MKKIFFVTLFLTSFLGYAQQSNVNNYKYVIIPKQFNFLSSPDQYQLNSLTKFLFEKYGFTAFFEDEKLPEDAMANRCLSLTANVKNNSGFLKTKNVIELKDCYNKVIYTSKEGSSKEKEYKKAFHEAVRDAFTSIKALHYKYNGQVVANTQPPVETQVPVKTEAPVKQTTSEPTKPIATTAQGTLYAQPITNGYQLINTKPEVVFQILKSSKENYYFLKDKDGVLFKKGDSWIAEYYQNNVLIQKQYQIKF